MRQHLHSVAVMVLIVVIVLFWTACAGSKAMAVSARSVSPALSVEGAHCAATLTLEPAASQVAADVAFGDACGIHVVSGCGPDHSLLLDGGITIRQVRFSINVMIGSDRSIRISASEKEGARSDCSVRMSEAGQRRCVK